MSSELHLVGFVSDRLLCLGPLAGLSTFGAGFLAGAWIALNLSDTVVMVLVDGSFWVIGAGDERRP